MNDDNMATMGSKPKGEQPGQLSDSKDQSGSSFKDQTVQETGNLDGWKLALVITGLCLAVFCMALVRPQQSLLRGEMTQVYPGQHHHCNRNPSYHRRVSRFR